MKQKVYTMIIGMLLAGSTMVQAQNHTAEGCAEFAFRILRGLPTMTEAQFLNCFRPAKRIMKGKIPDGFYEEMYISLKDNGLPWDEIEFVKFHECTHMSRDEDGMEYNSCSTLVFSLSGDKYYVKISYIYHNKKYYLYKITNVRNIPPFYEK